jgi:hypothetical protein
MNAEQKQRAIAALTKWLAADSNKAVLSTGYEMAGVLQELIDAPEPEQPNQSEQHLEMVNAPAPSVPDADLVRDAERYRWLRNDGAGFDISVAEIDDDGHESWVHGYPPEELDAAIDAAIEAEKGGTQ